MRNEASPLLACDRRPVFHKPSYPVGKDGRVVQTDAYGNKQYGKTQYQVRDGKVYETTAAAMAFPHGPAPRPAAQ